MVSCAWFYRYSRLNPHTYAVWLAVLAAAAIVFGALAAAGQKDFKRLVAYSSINHMGFVVLAIAAAACVGGAADEALTAECHDRGEWRCSANVQSWVERGWDVLSGRRACMTAPIPAMLENFGGLFAILPVYGSILLFISMASLGLPGLNGFVSEFMIVRGAWPIFTAFTAISMIGLFFTGVYVLKALKLVLHGPLNEQWAGKVNEISTSVKSLWLRH